jgi:hypothetical protein
MPLAQSAGYAVWLGGGLWIIGGLMEQRLLYVVLEAQRLTATALAVLLGGTWFGAVAIPPIVQGAVVAASLGSLAALWIIFKQLPAAHGHLSHQ